MEEKKPHVLIIAYLFPPIGGGGVQRALKMAKYLGNYDCQVSVLTVDGARHVTLDPALVEQIPEDVAIYRAKEWKLPTMGGVASTGSSSSGGKQATDTVQAVSISQRVKHWLKPMLRQVKEALLIPDDQILWYKQAVQLGEKIIRAEQVDVVFSTSGPYTNHLVGRALKQKTGVRWIADFRDPWTQNMHRPKLRWRLALEEKWEAAVMQEADLVTTVTHTFARNFQSKYPELQGKLQVIHNGFDPEDYQHIQVSKLHPEKWTFVYTGIFYQERNPRLFLEALAELIAEGKLERKALSVQFAGIFDYPGYTDNAQCVERLGLEDVVHVWGNLPHKDALSLLAGSNQLLLIGDVSADSGAYIPGKLFEYLAVKKPIFALTVEGESASIISNHNLGHVLPPFNKQAIKEKLLEEYQAWLAGEERVIQPTDTLHYQRDEQAKALAELVWSIVE